MPITARIVRAIRMSTCSAGWKQPNSIGNRSSATLAAGVVDAMVSAASISSSASPTTRRSRDSLRNRSIARRCAVRVNQAAGFGGTPSRRHVCKAATRASCTASSAMSKFPVRRCKAATIKPALRPTRRDRTASPSELIRVLTGVPPVTCPTSGRPSAGSRPLHRGTRVTAIPSRSRSPRRDRGRR